jgi:hypothetical protein
LFAGATIQAIVTPTCTTSPFLRLHAGENSIRRRFDFDDGFVGFHFESGSPL